MLIEPTDLGHPKQILDMLGAAMYEPEIDLRAILYLLDPRQLMDEKAINNENFRDQLAVADIIVANKADRATAESEQVLASWLKENANDRKQVITTQGVIDIALLNHPYRNTTPLPGISIHKHSWAANKGLAALTLFGNQRWWRSLNQGQDYWASGWIFDDTTVFDTTGLLEWALLIPVDRVKEVIRIAEGLVRINRQSQDFYIETQNPAPPDSRIQIITDIEADWNVLQSILLKFCLQNKDQSGEEIYQPRLNNETPSPSYPAA